MNTWPDKPGWPLNPEKDGWHWVKARPENLSALREKVPALWTAGNQHWIRGTYPPEYAAENWIYLGPVLTPDESTALQKRCEEAERELDALRRDTSDRIEALKKRIAKLTRLVEILIENDPDDMAADAVTVLDVWRGEARAALGGKDE